MELGFTIPLQRHLRCAHLPRATVPTHHSCWDLHIITLQGQSALLCVHCATRYTFTVYDLSLFQWGDVEGVFRQGLADTCKAIGVSVPESQALFVTGTHGRREVAFLNRAWEDVLALDYTLHPDTQSQPLLDYAVNTKSCNCAGFAGKGQPLLRFLSLFPSKERL